VALVIFSPFFKLILVRENILEGILVNIGVDQTIEFVSILNVICVGAEFKEIFVSNTYFPDEGKI